MAGKICTGTPTNNAGPANIRESKSFCEGMYHRSTGTAVAKPLTDNPFDGDGSEAETAWDAGWAVANSAAPSAISLANQACCSVAGVVAT